MHKSNEESSDEEEESSIIKINEPLRQGRDLRRSANPQIMISKKPSMYDSDTNNGPDGEQNGL